MKLDCFWTQDIVCKIELKKFVNGTLYDEPPKVEVGSFAVDKQISLLPLSGPGLSACATLEYFYKSESSTQFNPFLKNL